MKNEWQKYDEDFKTKKIKAKQNLILKIKLKFVLLLTIK